MIEAVSTCPSCLLQHLALDPQPLTHSRGKAHPRLGYYAYACSCGRTWLAGIENSEEMYRWCKRTNLLNPAPPLKANASTDRNGLMTAFVRPRIQRALARLL